MRACWELQALIMFCERTSAIIQALSDSEAFQNSLGNKPFLASTQELGITVGTNRNAGNVRSFFRAGLSYLRGKDTRGFAVNLGYWF